MKNINWEKWVDWERHGQFLIGVAIFFAAFVYLMATGLINLSENQAIRDYKRAISLENRVLTADDMRLIADAKIGDEMNLRSGFYEAVNFSEYSSIELFIENDSSNKLTITYSAGWRETTESSSFKLDNRVMIFADSKGALLRLPFIFSDVNDEGFILTTFTLDQEPMQFIKK